jgi:hypothetical protein
MRKEIDSIQGTIDSKRTAESPWSAAEVPCDRSAAALLHEIETFDRLERAYQDPGAFPVALAR